MKHIKGKLITGDFHDKTMTFEIDGDFTLQAGNYFLIREEDYKIPEMYETLKWFVNAIEDGSLIVFTDDDQHKAVRDENDEKIDKMYLLVKELES
jgi:hypothetical protein